MDYIFTWVLLGFFLVSAHLILSWRKIQRRFLDKSSLLQIGLVLGLLTQFIWVSMFLNAPFKLIPMVGGGAIIVVLGVYFFIGLFKRQSIRLGLTFAVCVALFCGGCFFLSVAIKEYQRISTSHSCASRPWPNLFYSTSALYKALYGAEKAPCLQTKI